LEIGGTNSGLFPATGFVIRSAGPSGSATIILLSVIKIYSFHTYLEEIFAANDMLLIANLILASVFL
jgi:hypothetical protein